MELPKTILLLDDDRWLLEAVQTFLSGYDVTCLPAITPAAAIEHLAASPRFAIVDLFLDGEAGSELSNNFIRDYLEPKGIPYGRLTSAPELVPEAFIGAWVLHKRTFRYNPEALLPLLNPFA